ncbi:MAG TPA: ATP-binding cassette domain-containing protein, partial [Opitutales bacterium]|nr:ATP-binding cassette domain-containing protein [Opitutales bacterium]
TLLRAVTGELEPASGRVEIAGQALNEWEPAALARRRACLPQVSTLSFPFTIREVVTIGRHPYRETRQSTQTKVEAALETVGLLDRADEGYLHLSGGEKQRVHLARVLAQLDHPEGRLLMLDEPTASLDLTYQQLVFSIAESWATAGAGVLVVLHDLNQAMHHARQVTILHQGRHIATGPPREVLTSEQIEGVYGVEAEWVDTHGHCLLAVGKPTLY